MSAGVPVLRRPPPVPVRRRDWRWYAACRDTDVDDFFAPDGERRKEHEKKAKKICKPCTVQDDCLATAIYRQEEHGVWGGLGVDEREELFTAAGKDPARAMELFRVRAEASA